MWKLGLDEVLSVFSGQRIDLISCHLHGNATQTLAG
jgi:hypothetical protein